MLYLTFHSALEASIVMLSVIYAMTGGVILQKILGYNFSVAVWVGYIALYGVAVQTGVVMVVYLHEALDKKLRQGPVVEKDIYEATMDGSVLRLRPKLMTVSVVLAGPAPNHVVLGRRLRCDETDRNAHHWRNDHLYHPCVDHHTGDLRPDEEEVP